MSLPDLPPDPYKLLGVAEDADAKTIKLKYFEKVKQCHPDKRGQTGDFQLIQEAWETLKNEEKRKEYHLKFAVHRLTEKLRKRDAAHKTMQQNNYYDHGLAEDIRRLGGELYRAQQDLVKQLNKGRNAEAMRTEQDEQQAKEKDWESSARHEAERDPEELRRAAEEKERRAEERRAEERRAEEERRTQREAEARDRREREREQAKEQARIAAELRAREDRLEAERKAERRAERKEAERRATAAREEADRLQQEEDRRIKDQRKKDKKERERQEKLEQERLDREEQDRKARKKKTATKFATAAAAAQQLQNDDGHGGEWGTNMVDSERKSRHRGPRFVEVVDDVININNANTRRKRSSEPRHRPSASPVRDSTRAREFSRRGSSGSGRLAPETPIYSTSPAAEPSPPSPPPPAPEAPAAVDGQSLSWIPKVSEAATYMSQRRSSTMSSTTREPSSSRKHGYSTPSKHHSPRNPTSGRLHVESAAAGYYDDTYIPPSTPSRPPTLSKAQTFHDYRSSRESDAYSTPHRTSHRVDGLEDDLHVYERMPVDIGKIKISREYTVDDVSPSAWNEAAPRRSHSYNTSSPLEPDGSYRYVSAGGGYSSSRYGGGYTTTGYDY